MSALRPESAYVPPDDEDSSEEITISIPANTTDLADVLVETLTTEQKQLIDTLPFERAKITSCSQIVNCTDANGRKPFSGIVRSLNRIETKMSIGFFNEKPAWAILIDKHSLGYLPVLQFITMDEDRYEHLKLSDAEAHLWTYPEFGSCSGNNLSALIKHYFFKSGLTVLYDLTLRKFPYRKYLLQAARSFDRHPREASYGSRPPKATANHNQGTTLRANNVSPFVPYQSASQPVQSTVEPNEFFPSSSQPNRPTAKVQKDKAAFNLENFKAKWSSLAEKSLEIQTHQNATLKQYTEAKRVKEVADEAVREAREALQIAEENSGRAELKIKDLQGKEQAHAKQKAEVDKQQTQLRSTLPEPIQAIFDIGFKSGKRAQEQDDDEPLIRRRRN